MNLRCAFCQTPFTLGRIEKLDALQEMDALKLSHYDAHCPRCRKATPVPRQKLEMTMPNWRDALKELETEMKANPQQEASLSQPDAQADSASEVESTPETAQAKHHRARAGSKAKAVAKAEAEKAAAKPKRASKKKTA